jgi:hypothetical protein
MANPNPEVDRKLATHVGNDFGIKPCVQAALLRRYFSPDEFDASPSGLTALPHKAGTLNPAGQGDELD